MDSKKKKKVFEAKKKMQNMTKEQIRAALEKKKECNARAISIVERLIDPNVDKNWMLDNLTHINQCHFQDAVEERAISKYCGYPLCDATLANIPSKQFHISTKQNKVFDITDRKNYCSNGCYKAGVFVKEQLFTSPLWLRDCEDAVIYKLFDSAPTCGITGLEVDLGHLTPARLDKDELIDMKSRKAKKMDSALVDSAKDLSDSEGEFEDARNDVDDIADKIENALRVDSRKEDMDEDEVFHLSRTSFGNGAMEKSVDERNEFDCIEINLSGDLDSSSLNSRTDRSEGRSLDKRKSKHQMSQDQSNLKKTKPNLPIGAKIEQFVMEWFTVDSLIFIYGEDAVKEKFAQFGSPLNAEKNQTIRDTYMYERYEEICRRLTILEIKDREAQAPTKPLPNYDKLKAEAKELELKVRSFYKGSSVVSFQVPEGAEEGTESSSGSDLQPILPLIDRHAIRATRRRIVLSKLNKTLPDILSALNLSQFNLRQEVHELVYTMSLSASNIVMKPPEWNLVALIIIRIMTIRSDCLKLAFTSDLTQRRMVNLLMTFNLDLNYLERQVLNINDVELIVRNSG